MKPKPETYGLRPEELELPPRADDPHGMAFSGDELDALTDVESDEARALALATASPEKRDLLKAKDGE